jgi:hypothetical protein
LHALLSCDFARLKSQDCHSLRGDYFRFCRHCKAMSFHCENLIVVSAAIKRESNPVAARSKAWVCGRSFAGIVGSNLSLPSTFALWSLHEDLRIHFLFSCISCILIFYHYSNIICLTKLFIA